MKILRLSSETIAVLERFLECPRDWRYGYDLNRATGLSPGTLYPILMRLARYALLEAKWVATEDGVPPRHMYRLTPKGLELAQTRLADLRPRMAIRQPVFHSG